MALHIKTESSPSSSSRISAVVRNPLVRVSLHGIIMFWGIGDHILQAGLLRPWQSDRYRLCDHAISNSAIGKWQSVVPRKSAEGPILLSAGAKSSISCVSVTHVLYCLVLSCFSCFLYNCMGQLCWARRDVMSLWDWEFCFIYLPTAPSSSWTRYDISSEFLKFQCVLCQSYYNSEQDH